MTSSLTLEFLIEALTGQKLDGTHPLGEPVFDSREVKPGALFLALPGEKADGHEFVADAFARGAIAALVDRDVAVPFPVVDLTPGAPLVRHPLSKLERGTGGEVKTPVVLRVEKVLPAVHEIARKWCRRWLDGNPDRRIIGVTGSVGKTTTKEVVADVLSQRFCTLRSIKSYNNEIGIPVTVLRLRDEHQRAVLEMSMYMPGDIRLLTEIAPPQVGVVTLIAPVHLERAGTMEAIVNAKAELVEALPPAPQGAAILNRDDARVMSLAGRTQAAIVTCGLNPQADLWADRIEGLGLEGIRFWLHSGERFGKREYAIHLPMLGQHSVHTALLAAAVGLVEGMGWEEVITGLESSRSQLRLIAVRGPRGSVILDDTYNASPPSMLAALNLLNDLMEGRRVAVLGDMLELGTEEERGHRDVGIRASAVLDLLVTVGTRSRMIAAEALRCRMPADAVRSFDTAEEAAQYLLTVIQPGDAILVKGSRAVGMERVVSILQQAVEQE